MNLRMTSPIALLTNHFKDEGINHFQTADDLKISEFQNNYQVVLPADFKQYFILINGSSGTPLNNLFEFYSIDKVNRVSDEFKDWKGIPDYHKLDFQKFKNVFIFGNYGFNFYSFGIELLNELSPINRIFIFCGKEHQIIKDNFSDFIDLYLTGPEEIFI